MHLVNQPLGLARAALRRIADPRLRGLAHRLLNHLASLLVLEIFFRAEPPPRDWHEFPASLCDLLDSLPPVPESEVYGRLYAVPALRAQAHELPDFMACDVVIKITPQTARHIPRDLRPYATGRLNILVLSLLAAAGVMHRCHARMREPEDGFVIETRGSAWRSYAQARRYACELFAREPRRREVVAALKGALAAAQNSLWGEPPGPSPAGIDQPPN